MSGELFETSGADKELTYPIRAGEIKIGMIILLDNHPCKVISIDVSKTGKHGHAKAVFMGIDIFTDKKYTDMSPTSHNMYAPFVYTSNWAVACTLDDDFCSLINDNGETKEDLRFPYILDLDKIITSEKEIKVIVTKAMNMEKITSYTIASV